MKKEEEAKAAALKKKEDIEKLFFKADELLFVKNNIESAKKIYDDILKLDTVNIDAKLSKAYCIKIDAVQNGTLNTEEVFT